MAPAVHQVEFSPVLIYLRPPRDDELYVMEEFALHAEQCPRCGGTYLDHSALCETGIDKAKDVAQYLYNRDGKAHSVVDTNDSGHMQIEIPCGYEAVRKLLKALARGMQLSPPNTYCVPTRTARKITHQPQYETAISSNHRRDRVVPPGRDSLYHFERAKRKQQPGADIVYYEANDGSTHRSLRYHC